LVRSLSKVRKAAKIPASYYSLIKLANENNYPIIINSFVKFLPGMIFLPYPSSGNSKPPYRHEIPSSHNSNKLQYITSMRYHHPGATNYLSGMIYPSSCRSKPPDRHEIPIIL
jgi:hypothetical protein